MRITQDIHIHTYISPCAQADATAQFYIENARERGLSLIGFSDHMWDNGRGYKIASYERHNTEYPSGNLPRIMKIKEDIAKVAIPDGLRVLIGCEGDFTADSTLGVSREVARQLDYVMVAHSHTHFPEICPSPYRDDRIACGKFSVEAFKRLMRHPDADIITTVAHPMGTHFVGDGDVDIMREISNAEFREAFLMAADKGIGIEINACVVMFCCQAIGIDGYNVDEMKNLELYRMLSVAKEAGCRFTFGSDAHSRHAVTHFRHAQAMADALELTDDDVILL